uniref:Uncharacterized protein n=1 Tax=Knipowitschia caucasica TaxID=637954 RepID=A0AAV2JID8_KNICA
MVYSVPEKADGNNPVDFIKNPLNEKMGVVLTEKEHIDLLWGIKSWQFADSRLVGKAAPGDTALTNLSITKHNLTKDYFKAFIIMLSPPHHFGYFSLNGSHYYLTWFVFPRLSLHPPEPPPLSLPMQQERHHQEKCSTLKICDVYCPKDLGCKELTC